MNTLHTIAFTVYPYVCLAFFLIASAWLLWRSFSSSGSSSGPPSVQRP